MRLQIFFSAASEVFADWVAGCAALPSTVVAVFGSVAANAGVETAKSTAINAIRMDH
jgi:hypothetical protein